MTTSTSTPSLAAPRLRIASFADYPQIQQLEAEQLQEPLPSEDWRRLWLDNPLWPRLGNNWPIGWVLEDPKGRVVGSVSSIPSLYQFRGQELICANGKTWIVAPEYRSFALWVMEEYFNQPGVDLFFNTTVNANAVAVFNTLSERCPVGDWESVAYWITGYRGFARKVLERLRVPGGGTLAYPAAAALLLKDSLCVRTLPAPPAGVSVSFLDGFNSRFDYFWSELVRQNPNKLLAVRDALTLAWHYAIPLRRGRLRILTAVRNGLLRAYCVLSRQDWTTGFRRMRVVDYQTVDSDLDLLPALLQAAIQRCAAEDFYVLEHLGRGLPKMCSLDRHAPYRRRLSNWPFFYRASDPGLATVLRQPEVWNPSCFDGNCTFN